MSRAILIIIAAALAACGTLDSPRHHAHDEHSSARPSCTGTPTWCINAVNESRHLVTVFSDGHSLGDVESGTTGQIPIRNDHTTHLVNTCFAYEACSICETQTKCKPPRKVTFEGNITIVISPDD